MNYSTIIKPRITEKAGIMSQSSGVYTFEVADGATKGAVKSAIKALYKVTPTKIHMVRLPAKTVFVRGKKGVSSGHKKAIVYLKKGDKIELL